MKIAAAAFLVLAPLTLRALAGEEEIRKAIGASLPDAKITGVRKLPKLDLYEVVLNKKNIIYTDVLGEVAFVGRMMNVRTHEDLTQARQNELTRVDFSALPLERAIKIVKGSGARKVAIFSDPDCPFCKQLEKELEGVSDVTIYTFLFPLASIHPDAPRKSKLIWCAPDRAKAWNDMMLKGREPDNAGTCDAPINANLDLGEKLSIEGTPGIVFPSGRLVPGAVKREVLEKYLDEKALPPA